MTAGLILTQVGADEIEAAYRAGSVVNIITASFGDGGGQPVVASPAVTSLAGRFGEVPLAAGETVDGMIGGTAIIPCADYPGRVVREFGLESDSGTLIAYGAYPDTYLPGQSDSVIKELIVKFVMTLVHAECVTLVVDPNIAILTQDEGDKRYYRQSLHLEEVKDEGATAQQTLRGNIGCGTASTKDWGYTPGKLLPVNAFGLGTYSPVDGAVTEGGNRLESMAFNTGLYAHKGGYTQQGYGYGMPSELIDNEDYAVIAVKASSTASNIVFSLVWAPDGLWFDSLDQGMSGRKKWAKVFSDRHPPTAENVGLGNVGNYPAVRANGGTHNEGPHRIAIDWGIDGKLWASVDDTDQGMFYTSKNPPPEPNLSEYMRGDWSSAAGFVADSANDPYMHHTSTGENVLLARRDWVVSGSRQASLMWSGAIGGGAGFIAPAGCVLVGARNNGSSDVSHMGVAYVAEQICINGQWVTIGRV